MDDSTEGVTLLSGFVFDVLAEFEDMRRICAPAFDMAAHLDRERPGDPCAFTGMKLKAGSKFDFVVQVLEGRLPYTVELTIFADPEC